MTVDADALFLAPPGSTDPEKIRKFKGRMLERHKRIIDANLPYIQGKRILDLTSNNGRWSHAVLKAGATRVFGIEVRQKLIDYGISAFAEFDASRWKFVCGDIYDMKSLARDETFDTILCLGIFYHTTDHYRLIRLMRSFNPSTIIFDSSFIKTDEMIAKFKIERTSDPSMTMPEGGGQDIGLAGISSLGFLRQAAKISGYDFEMVPWNHADVEHADTVADYLDDSRSTRRYTIRLSARPDKPDWRHSD